MMPKVLDVLKEKWKLLIVLAVVLAIALFLFVPRNLGKLYEVHDRTITEITLHGIFADAQEPHISVTLSLEQQKELLQMLEETYVFRNPITKKYSNGGEAYVGYYFELVSEEPYADGAPLVNYFTKDIICVNGVQYRFYGDDFEEYFEDLVERDKI